MIKGLRKLYFPFGISIVLIGLLLVFSNVEAQSQPSGPIKVKAGIEIEKLVQSTDGSQLFMDGTAHGGIYNQGQVCPAPAVFRYDAAILVADVPNETGGISRLTDRAQYKIDNGTNGSGVVPLTRIQIGQDRTCADRSGTEKEYLYSFDCSVPSANCAISVANLSPGRHTLSLCAIAHTDLYDDPDICAIPELEFVVQPPTLFAKLRVEASVDNQTRAGNFIDSWRVITPTITEQEKSVSWPDSNPDNYKSGYKIGLWQAHPPNDEKFPGTEARYEYMEFWKNDQCFLNCGGGQEFSLQTNKDEKIKIVLVYKTVLSRVSTIKVFTNIEDKLWPEQVGVSFALYGPDGDVSKQPYYSSQISGHENPVVLNNVPAGSWVIKAQTHTNGNVHALWRINSDNGGNGGDKAILENGKVLTFNLDYLYFGRDIGWSACELSSRKATFLFRATDTSLPLKFYEQGFEKLPAQWGYGRYDGQSINRPRGLAGNISNILDTQNYKSAEASFITNTALHDGWNIFDLKGSVKHEGMTPGINDPLTNVLIGWVYGNCGVTNLNAQPLVVEGTVIKGSGTTLPNLQTSIKNLAKPFLDQSVNPEVIAGWKQEGSIEYKQGGGWISTVEFPQVAKLTNCERSAGNKCTANPSHPFSVYTQDQLVKFVLSDSVRDLAPGVYEAKVKFAGPVYLEFPNIQDTGVRYNTGDQLSRSGYGRSETEVTIRITVKNQILTCTSDKQRILQFEQVNFTANGGNGVYQWKGPLGATPPLSTSKVYSPRFFLPGFKLPTEVTSGDQKALCGVDVLPFPVPDLPILSCTDLQFQATAGGVNPSVQDLLLKIEDGPIVSQYIPHEGFSMEKLDQANWLSLVGALPLKITGNTNQTNNLVKKSAQVNITGLKAGIYDARVLVKATNVRNIQGQAVCNVILKVDEAGKTKTASLRVEARIDSAENQSGVFKNQWHVVTPTKTESQNIVPWPQSGYQDGYATGSWTIQRPADDFFPGNSKAVFNHIEIFIEHPNGRTDKLFTESDKIPSLVSNVGNNDKVKAVFVYKSISCNLTANPINIINGQFSTLAWASTGAEEGEISNNLDSRIIKINNVSSGNTIVSPDKTTKYTMLVRGNENQATCDAVINVDQDKEPNEAVLGCSSKEGSSVLNFNYQIGDPPPTVEDLYLDITGGSNEARHDQLNFQKVENASWLNLGVINKTSIIGNTNHIEQDRIVKSVIGINISNLRAGNYNAQIRATAANVQNSSAICRVNLIVEERGTKSCILNIVPSRIPQGESAELEWRLNNVSDCQASRFPSGSEWSGLVTCDKQSCQKTITPSSSHRSTVYSLSCNNGATRCSSSVSVFATPPPERPSEEFPVCEMPPIDKKNF
ncbi:MAG: hypothetical protein HYW77_00610 [Parcubacteria group bacterium]|nr:hypothetical protein [Parcubacteria group bacterium]